MTIRAASERDASAIACLWTTAYVGEGEGGRTVPYSTTDVLKAARNAQIFVAEQRGDVVGVVALAAPGTPGRAVAQTDEAKLSRLVVAASARRLGIGRALVAHCEELAKAAGWRRSRSGAVGTRWRPTASTSPSATGAFPSGTGSTRAATRGGSSGGRSDASPGNEDPCQNGRRGEPDRAPRGIDRRPRAIRR